MYPNSSKCNSSGGAFNLILAKVTHPTNAHSLKQLEITTVKLRSTTPRRHQVQALLPCLSGIYHDLDVVHQRPDGLRSGLSRCRLHVDEAKDETFEFAPVLELSAVELPGEMCIVPRLLRHDYGRRHARE